MIKSYLVRRFNLFLLIILSILFLQTNCGCREQEEIVPASHPAEYVSGEIIVKFASEAFDDEGELASESIQVLNDKYGLISMEPVFKGKPISNLAHIYKLIISRDIDMMQAAEEYTEEPLVVYAEPNYIIHAQEKDKDAD